MTAPEFDLDLDREKRTGFPEAVFGPGKSPRQLEAIVGKLLAHDMPVIATRLDGSQIAALEASFSRTSDLVFDPEAGIVWRPRRGHRTTVEKSIPRPVRSSVAVVSAGTSDFRTAREAEVTLRCLDVPFVPIRDVGVAGIHRLMNRIEELRAASVIIVIAGMDGALVPVAAGLVHAPVIAVPTSNGYGVALNGLSAMLSMMNSCSPGTAVVNIDNGFGAAVMAARIWAMP